MQYYMITTSQIVNNRVNFFDDELHHIFKVMRMRKNDELICVDYQLKVKYLCCISDDNEIVIVKEISEDNELKNNLVLAFGLVKSDKLEFVIQKASELGVKKFIPLIMKNSIIKVNDDKVNKKMLRWQKISKEACEQARRNTIMEISQPLTISELLKHQQTINLVAYENAAQGLKIRDYYQANKDCLIVVGPEGGISNEEITILEANGFQQVSLGKRILRCESAAISSLSILVDLME
ncbi:16S rRNA (uracil(1498)-N(3))-methyltransferase [Erysipelotrichaceae bacterium OttesenSCG-928-M19]|nr:16S rRNA (uracil(1498)-N(3))-methyltransferase [Erysipelotrichaceae bacterium OttesenSCG-928-M19]